MIYKKITKPPHIELVGDNSERRFRFWGPVKGAEDNDGELTPPEAMKANMDWFINELGGPITINHSHRVIGHCVDWGLGEHPKTGTPAMWIEGVITRGPNGKDFPAADTAWNKLKAGEAKGSSWAGDILKEVKEMDSDTFKEKVTNEEVLPYSYGLVIDYANERPNPALADSEIISVNDKAKTQPEFYIEILEEQPMEDKEKTEEVPVEEKEKTEEPEQPSPEFVTMEQLTAWGEKFKTDLMGILAPPSKEKADPEEQPDKPADEEEEKPMDDEDEKCNAGKKKTDEEETVDIDALVQEKVKAEMEKFIDKVGVPKPMADTHEKEKTEKQKIDLNKYNKLPLDKRHEMLAELYKED